MCRISLRDTCAHRAAALGHPAGPAPASGCGTNTVLVFLLQVVFNHLPPAPPDTHPGQGKKGLFWKLRLHGPLPQAPTLCS